MRLGRVFLAIAIAAVIGLVAVNATGPAGSSAQSATSRVQLGAVMVGGNEVNPGDTDGWGLADVWVEGSEVCWKITVTSIDAPTAAHIHAGPRGVSGPVVVPLSPIDEGCTNVTARLARFLKRHPGEFYVNVHNGAFPSGAIRGQLSK